MKIRTISSINELKEFCEKSFHDKPPFINFDFFINLEKTKCTYQKSGWIPEHIVIEKKKSIIAIIPNFKKFNSNGEYVFDHIFANAHHQLGINYFPKYLSAIPFTPVSREKFIYPKEKIDNEELLNNLKDFLMKKEISSFHINFINKKNSNLLNTYGFTQRLGIQYFWYNHLYKDFNDYLSKLKRNKRKNIVKEREYLKNLGITFLIKKGREINIDDINLFYMCYLNTINKKWGIPYLNGSFFTELIKTNQVEKLLIIQAFKKNKFLGCSIHFLGLDTLYGRYWGCLEEVKFLHFELCYYQAIEFAIKNGIQKVEAGAQGEHKIARGYIPELTFSNHWFKTKSLEEPIKVFLKEERKKVNESLKYLNGYNPFND